MSTWLTTRQRSWIVAPDPSSELALKTYKYWAAQVSPMEPAPLANAIQPWLLFVGGLPDFLQAAVAITTQICLPVAIVTSTDALLETLLDQETSAQLASAALQGLVPIEPVEDENLTTVVNARSASAAPPQSV